ncbi:UNVERIFIED_CONTAM: hypothetical protein K2H54_054997 [Gekko kuhli]
MQQDKIAVMRSVKANGLDKVNYVHNGEWDYSDQYWRDFFEPLLEVIFPFSGFSFFFFWAGVEEAGRVIGIGHFHVDRLVSEVDVEAIGVEAGGSKVGASEVIFPGGAEEDMATGVRADFRRATWSHAAQFFQVLLENFKQ